MNIALLQGSPNITGSTALLCEQFTQGARASGHEVDRIDLAELSIAPCTGCGRCGYGAHPCVQHDDMRIVRETILDADMVVFATPLYYYGMSAQLKIVIDRFCADNIAIESKRLKAALISPAWNADSWTFDALVLHYQTLCRYLHMQDKGMILGYGCGTPGMTKHSSAMNEAYELGASL